MTISYNLHVENPTNPHFESHICDDSKINLNFAVIFNVKDENSMLRIRVDPLNVMDPQHWFCLRLNYFYLFFSMYLLRC